MATSAEELKNLFPDITAEETERVDTLQSDPALGYQNPDSALGAVRMASEQVAAGGAGTSFGTDYAVKSSFPTASTPTTQVNPTAPPPEQGTFIGNQVFSQEQLSAMTPQDKSLLENSAAQSRIRDYAQAQGIGLDEATRRLGLEQYGASVMNPDLAPLTQEQITKRAQEQNAAIYANKQRDIQKQFEEQNKLMQTETDRAKGLARFQMARGGSLFTSTQGGLQAGGAINVEGPDTILRDIQDEHDRNRAKLDQARDTALTLAQDAFNSGKFQIARQAMQDAKDAALQAEEANSRYQENVSRTLDNAARVRQLAQQDIATIVEGGNDKVFDDPAFVSQYAKQTGMPEDVVKGVVSIGRSEALARQAKSEAEVQKASFENAGKLVDVLNKIPVGQTLNIGGVSYQGQKTGEYATGTETDSEGNVTFYSFDKNTGKVQTTSLGSVGKAQDGWDTQIDDSGNAWRINARTGQMQPFYPSDAQKTWSQAFPDGQVGPMLPGGDPKNAGQCGAFTNFLYGQRILGDSYDQKVQALSKYSVPRENVRVGDTFLMDVSTTGHVGVVNGIEQGPDGKTYLRFTESNFVPPGGAKLSNTRTAPIDDRRLTMFARVPTPNLPAAGPDAPYSGSAPTFGEKGVKAGQDQLLTVAESKALGLPYGTTRSEAAAKGITPGVSITGGNEAFAKLKPTQKESFLEVMNIEDKLGAIKELKDQVNTGPIRAGSQWLRSGVGAASENYLKLQEITQSLTSTISKAISGAAISEQEAARLSKFIPSPKDQDQTFRSKLGTLIEEYQGVLDKKARLYGFENAEDFKAAFSGEPAKIEDSVDSIPAGGTWTDPVSGQTFTISD